MKKYIKVIALIVLVGSGIFGHFFSKPDPVKIDLENYINKDLPKITALEDAIIEDYESAVSGDDIIGDTLW